MIKQACGLSFKSNGVVKFLCNEHAHNGKDESPITLYYTDLDGSERCEACNERLKPKG